MKKVSLVFVALFAALSFFSVAEARSIQRYQDFKAYPANIRDRNCVLAVDVSIDYMENTVTLRNFVEGGCEIFIEPSDRVYKLVQRKKISGGYAYYGKFMEGRAMGKTIVIVDNRPSQDMRKPDFIVRENFQNNVTNTYYARDIRNIILNNKAR